MIIRYINTSILWSLKDAIFTYLKLLFFNYSFKEDDLDQDYVFNGAVSSRFIGFSSGRASLEFSLKLFSDIYPHSNEVIVPSYLCGSVYGSIINAGLTPIICKIGDDLNICPSSCISKISKNTLAVIVPHIYGYPADIQRVASEVKSINGKIFVIDDAASSMGQKVGDSYLGLMGDVGLFSYNQGKFFSATGGGILAINNPDLHDYFLYEYMNIACIKTSEKFLEFFRFSWNFKFPYISSIINYYFYKLFKSRLLEHKPLQGRRLSMFDYLLVKNSFLRIMQNQKLRQNVVEYYNDKIYGLEGVHIPQATEKYFVSRYCVHIPGLRKLKSDPTFDLLQNFKNKKIHFQYGYKPFNDQYNATDKSNRKITYSNDLLILPINVLISVEDHSVVIDAIKEILAELSLIK